MKSQVRILSPRLFRKLKSEPLVAKATGTGIRTFLSLSKWGIIAANDARTGAVSRAFIAGAQLFLDRHANGLSWSTLFAFARRSSANSHHRRRIGTRRLRSRNHRRRVFREP